MNVLFVNYHDFTSNSATHIFSLANQLSMRGVACAVCVPERRETVHTLGIPRFDALTYGDVVDRGLTYPDGRGPDLIHAWTPRESVRQFTEALAARYRCGWAVHLEDNEDVVTARHLGLSVPALLALPDERLDEIINGHLSHPRRAREFLRRAAGVSVIIDRLLEWKPAEVLGVIIWPGFDEDLFVSNEVDPALRLELRIWGGDYVLVYPGNIHPVNLTEARTLYLAVGALNQRRVPTTLVRLGQDLVDPVPFELAWVRRHVIDLGVRPHLEVPKYLALADALVQPGKPDEFNDYRLPSKLPEFFAMGKPVVLPATNIGLHVRDGEDAVLLRDGSALELAAVLERLFADPDSRRRLGRAARAFAETHLTWSQSATKLLEFYHQITAATDTVAPLGPQPQQLVARYAQFDPPRLSYATVEDYSDSLDHLPELAGIQHDLKDVQRPWVLKAILGRVPLGGKLLEIGGGDPWVADILGRLGYEVWIADPYDGRGNGPTGFDAVRARHPHLRFLRGLFPEALDEFRDGRFDAIYSISVLEHIPQQEIARVMEGIHHYAKGGITIHAVDHVLKGAGAEEHLTRLSQVVTALGIDQSELPELLVRLEDDPDAYFLSAEAHNRWRGNLEYREFPMRRCVSINICTPIE